MNFWYAVLMIGLAVQAVWMLLGRRGREFYIRDITSFRKPSSLTGRYYGWHLSGARNALTEGVALDIVLVLVVYGVALFLGDSYLIIAALPVLVFVLALSFISPLQTASRVGGLAEIERKLSDEIGQSTDKVGRARAIVENLLSPLQIPDGRYWFALFRIALRQDPIGWSVRDVLMEKAKDLDLLAERVRSGERVSTRSPPSESGAEIE